MSHVMIKYSIYQSWQRRSCEIRVFQNCRLYVIRIDLHSGGNTDIPKQTHRARSSGRLSSLLNSAPITFHIRCTALSHHQAHYNAYKKLTYQDDTRQFLIPSAIFVVNLANSVLCFSFEKNGFELQYWNLWALIISFFYNIYQYLIRIVCCTSAEPA